jgi:hypothetical protein
MKGAGRVWLGGGEWDEGWVSEGDEGEGDDGEGKCRPFLRKVSVAGRGEGKD